MTTSKYPGIEIYGFHPASLTDKDLMREAVLNARAEFEFWSRAEKSPHSAAYMSDSIGPLFCHGNLAPVIGEIRSRAAGGSNECLAFLSAGESVIRGIQKSGFNPDSDESYAVSFANYIYQATKNSIIREYSGHHNQTLQDSSLGAKRPGTANSDGQLATSNATP